MSLYVKLRYILKVVSAAAWVIVLSVTYAYTWDNAPGFAQTIKSWFGSNSSAPSLFILAVVVYLSPNMLAAIFFMFPFIRRYLERSNYRIVMLMMWWSQVHSNSTFFFPNIIFVHLQSFSVVTTEIFRF
jgi:callose synthase